MVQRYFRYERPTQQHIQKAVQRYKNASSSIGVVQLCWWDIIPKLLNQIISTNVSGASLTRLSLVTLSLKSILKCLSPLPSTHKKVTGFVSSRHR